MTENQKKNGGDSRLNLVHWKPWVPNSKSLRFHSVVSRELLNLSGQEIKWHEHSCDFRDYSDERGPAELSNREF